MEEVQRSRGGAHVRVKDRPRLTGKLRVKLPGAAERPSTLWAGVRRECAGSWEASGPRLAGTGGTCVSRV